MIRFLKILPVLAGLAAASLVQAADTWTLRLRAVDYHPRENGDSGFIRAGGVPVGAGIRIENDIKPEIGLLYRFHDRFAIEASVSVTEHDINLRRAAPALGLADGTRLADPLLISPTVTFQYRARPIGPVHPYLGVGVNWTSFTGDEPAGRFTGATGADFDDDVAPVVQAGADIPLRDRLHLNLDVRYIDSDTSVTFNTTSVGATDVHVDIEPLVFGVGLGWTF